MATSPAILAQEWSGHPKFSFVPCGPCGSVRFAWMATLFPSAAAATAMTDLNAVINHYNVAPEIWTAFTDKCGDPGNDLRMLGALPPQVIVAACQAAQLPSTRPLTAIQASQIGLVYRLARRILHLQAGGAWEEWVDIDPWNVPVSAATGRTTASTTTSTSMEKKEKERKLKMAQILDQGDDTEFVVESESSRSTWLQRLRTLTGGLPMEEEEPTIEQVSALLKRTVVMDLNPYADFGIFVPYGAKALRASKFRTYTLTPEGYAVKELQGPATYIQWRSCFRVYTTALLMLNIADLAPLRAYELFVEKLVRQFPTCWHLIYMAEDLARGSHSTRMRMMMSLDAKEGKGPKGWEEERPWNSVFRQLPQEEDFWRAQVYGPALTWLAHGGRGKAKTPAEQYAVSHLRDGLEAVQQEEEKEAGALGDGELKKNGNRARREARKRRRLADREELEQYRSRGDQGGKNKGGKGKQGGGKGQPQLCFGWNNGNGPCASLPPGQECLSRVKRIHKCTICGSPGHPSKDCTKKE